MLQKFDIQGEHTKVDLGLRKYVTKKIGGLDKYISRHDRISAHAQIHLKEGKAKDKNRFTCEVKLVLPHDTIIITESTVNFYAAVDIAEAKLKKQLKKHKDLHQSSKTRRHILARFTRKTSLRLEQLSQPEA